jgi:hypothetical protein
LTGVFSGTGDNAVHLGQGRIVDAPCIDGADAEVNSDRGEGDAPAIVTGGRDDAFLAEKIRHKSGLFLVVIGLLPPKIEADAAAIIYSI